MASKKIFVTIEYSKPGTQPPIYVAGSFSSPQWRTQEMQYTTREGNEHDFSKEVEVEEGKEYQYKFRIGSGDWWVLNEDSPIVTDNVGNRNNLLTVPQHQENEDKLEETEAAAQIPLEDKKEPVGPTSADEAQSQISIDSKIEVPEKLGGDIIPSIVPATLTKTQIEQPEDTNEISGTSSSNNTTSTPSTMEENQVESVDTTNTAKGHLVDPINLTEASAMTSSTEDFEEIEPVPLTNTAVATISQVKNVYDTKTSPQSSSSSDIALTPTSAVESSVVDANEIATPEKVASPILVVEKTDLELRHGDDFGATATFAQKDAHHLRAQDAEPDKSSLRQQSRTPDVAAEVAESAAMLDREEPTPPISNEEAGKLGYRRMSSTPISEVANTAAEVADAARKLDKTDIIWNRDMEGYIGNLHIDLSLPESARNLSFEERNELKRQQAELRDKENEKWLQTEGAKIIADREYYLGVVCRKADKFKRSEETDKMWKDVLKAREEEVEDAYYHGLRFETLQLPEQRHLMQIAQHTTQRYWCKASEARAHPDGYEPWLEADIAMEEDRLEFYKYRATVESGEIVERDLGSIDEDAEEGLTTSLSAGPDIAPGNETTIKANGVEADEGAISEDVWFKEPPVEDGGMAVYQNNSSEEIESKEPNTETGGRETDEQITGKETELKELVANPNDIDNSEMASKENEHKGGQSEVGAVMTKASGTNKENGSTVEVHEVRPESPPETDGSFHGTSLDGEHFVPSPVTPFVVGNRQLGHDEDQVQEILTGTDGPNIMVQPATPGGGSSTKPDPLSKPVDTAKVTAIEEQNGRSKLKQRKREPSPAAERPLTPSSMRSAGQDAKSKNFLKAFWRIVFVDWIGGLIMRLCGGNRHTALVLSALILVTLAPALYFAL